MGQRPTTGEDFPGYGRSGVNGREKGWGPHSQRKVEFLDRESNKGRRTSWEGKSDAWVKSGNHGLEISETKKCWWKERDIGGSMEKKSTIRLRGLNPTGRIIDTKRKKRSSFDGPSGDRKKESDKERKPSDRDR